MLIIVLILFLFVCYGALILYYWRCWISIPDFIPGTQQQIINVSIIIPARNEEKNIGRLLTSLQHQNYPQDSIQIIVIDDHSTDQTATIAAGFPNVRVLPLHADDLNSYKKKAIETGIAAATGELIITTDADCICGPNWLSTIVAFQQQQKLQLVAAPVQMERNNSLLQIFQAYDFAVLQGITGASLHHHLHSMGNGANLAYTKSSFIAVDGFTNIDHIASGDDMLLMKKIADKFPQRTGYVKSKEAIVRTQPAYTLNAFLNQRIRWASKATHYTDKKVMAILFLVYLFNLSFLFLTIAGFWNHTLWLLLLILWFAKTAIEWPFVSSVMRFFSMQSLMKFFLLLQPLHILYTITSGFLGQFGKYEWKGRRVK